MLLYYLAVLNLADAFLTIKGIENSLITEANPLMEFLYTQDLKLFLLLKILLSVLLFMFILNKSVLKSKWVVGLTIFAAACYTMVFGVHMYWLVKLI